MNEPQWSKEGRWPTPEEWTDHFDSLPRDRKLQKSRIMLEALQEANQCMMMDHVGEITYLLEYSKLQYDKIQLGRWLIQEARWVVARDVALSKLTDDHE